ncbi:MAG TPA: DUF2844 domain-containing protein [Terriglobales bacterium]|jgi:hypothetical protein|nr:DUF2844 domain-containing protein [Terriglobales bacterium]
MQTSMWGITQSVAVRLKWPGAILLTLALSMPAFAALGGDEASVEADRAQMNATVEVTKADNYSVHEMKTSTGVIREYVSSDGRVFGVAWSGQFIPDMRQLLGTYFQQYSAGVKAQHDAGPGRRPLSIQQPNLVVVNTGHMRSFRGRAYDPGLLPQGVAATAVR